MATDLHAGAVGPPPQRPREFNGLAIAALALGILVGYVPVAIVLGVIALRQIKRRGERGRGMAIAGIAISAAWLLGIVLIAVLATNTVERDDRGQITGGGLMFQDEARRGDCVDGRDEGSGLILATPCGDEHDAEVFARFTLTGDDGYPGADNISRRAGAGCAHRLYDLYPELRPGRYTALVRHVTSFTPDRLDWVSGDQDVICFADFDPPRRGSLQPG